MPDGRRLKLVSHRGKSNCIGGQSLGFIRAVKMVDVVMPTIDGRIITLPRYVEPKQDLSILLDRLGLTLPAKPPPKISGEAADAAKTTV